MLFIHHYSSGVNKIFFHPIAAVFIIASSYALCQRSG